MRRILVILPAATASLAALGSLMYAGSRGYDCVGPYDSRSVAHPPIAWPWYVAAAALALVVSLVPLCIACWRRVVPWTLHRGA